MTGENGIREPGAERVARKGDDAGRGESVPSVVRDGRRSGQKSIRGDDHPGVNGVQLPPACGKGKRAMGKGEGKRGNTKVCTIN